MTALKIINHAKKMGYSQSLKKNNCEVWMITMMNCTICADVMYLKRKHFVEERFKAEGKINPASRSLNQKWPIKESRIPPPYSTPGHGNWNRFERNNNRKQVKMNSTDPNNSSIVDAPCILDLAASLKLSLLDNVKSN